MPRESIELTPDEATLELLELQSASIPLGASPHDLYCKRSGLLLGQFIPVIRDGADILFRDFHESAMFHPVYGYDGPKLLTRLHAALHSAAELNWQVEDSHQIRVRLLVSAVMWKLDCIKQERACLPSWRIAAGSAARILALAKWYWQVSSQRLAFPVYSTSARHNNLDWNNLRWWIDASFEVKTAWETKSRKAAQKQELVDQSESVQLALRKQVYKRLDLKKVWNWIELQLVDGFSRKQLDYWKELFLDGDLEPHMWVLDDVTDLHTTIAENCDIGNEISFFIDMRLKAIRALIEDYLKGFTLVGASKNSEQPGLTEQETAMMAGLDQQVAEMETLPPAPEQKDFPTLGSFMKAQAQWNLLSKRFNRNNAK